MIELKTKDEVEKIRRAGRIVAEILARLTEAAKPGMTTLDLDELAEKWTLEAGAVPAFKGYHGFPGTLCTSVNEEVVHGIPNDRPLKDGDIISVDFGVKLDGFFADSATTVPVGEVSAEVQKLMDATQKSLALGIEQARPENRLEDIGFAVQSYCEGLGYGVVREYVGHGIGRELHEPPQVPNFGRKGKGLRIRPGMVLCLEPMINLGTAEVETLDDGWTVVTKDRKPSAHFEHAIAILEDRTEILTTL
ncbi:MAG: type I methionyl aminopeptidase [Chrysiogenetes bacterium]|nr:type I methionyl aminopeptidase [Chrysiogenetes bacterium]